jgi:hypothetical protein
VRTVVIRGQNGFPAFVTRLRSHKKEGNVQPHVALFDV